VATDPTARPSITACVVAYNEEAVIERCLRSLQDVVDETIVVHDGPCDDRTVEIAEQLGCRVFVREHAGHCEHHRPFVYEQARGEWVLKIDADEYLSDDLRAGLRELAEDRESACFAFEWPIWDGERYVTEGEPFKKAMFRRSAIRLMGLIHRQESVDGPVREVPLRLEHRPLYNNYAWRVIVTKWRRWARIQAAEYLHDLRGVPKFRCDADDWSWKRKLANRLSPLLVVPYALTTFAVALRGDSSLNLGQRVRFSAYQGVYVGLVQAYVVKLLYLDRARRARHSGVFS
jgi:glycosyltransferase involved in cell wall biosynthesis